jgi:hypothetical protein
MDVVKHSTLWPVILFILGCSSGQTPEPPPPAKTVFDPLTQQLDRARDVQKTVDQHTDSTRKAVDGEERGDPSP